MKKDKTTALEYVQNTLLDTEIMSYIFTGLLVAVLLLISFIDFSNARIGFDRLTEEEFWRTFILRFTVVYIARYIYIRLGIKKEIDLQLDLDNEITSKRKDIEKVGRLDEFDQYAKNVIDVIDTLDTYENMLTKKIVKWQAKQRKRSKVETLLKERKTLREYRTQFMSSLDKKAVSIDFEIDNIVLSGRIDITADILFDGYNETEIGGNVSVAYNQSQESRKALNKGALMSVIMTMAITFFINDVLLSGDNFGAKLINLSISLIIMTVSIVLALYVGKNIGKNVGISKSKRIRYMNNFINMTPRTYEHKEETEKVKE
jgi:hypothetical protein